MDTAEAVAAALAREAELRKQHDHLQTVAQQEAAKLESLQEGSKTLELRLAEALLRPKKGDGPPLAAKQAVIRAVDLLRSWDSNGDSQISRQEFRDAMHKL
eukprot:5518855-Prymnesium_polylepis.1